MVGTYTVEITTRFLSNLIMTRLLFPEAFGLVAASTSIIIGLTLISDFGIRSVIVQSPRGENEDFLRSAWVFQISRGVLLWLVLVVGCSILSLSVVRDVLRHDSVFADPSFPMLTIALGLGVLLNDLESTALPLNARRLNYRPIAYIDVIGKISSLPIMFACAAIAPSAWALVVGALVGGTMRLVLSHTVLPGPRMAWKWNSEHFKEFVNFGKWITISSIASFIGSQSDVILFGIFFPSTLVGIYFIAKMLVGAFEGLLNKLGDTLTLTVLSEVIRNNPADLRNRYYRFRLPIDVFAAVCAGALCVMGDQIVRFLYDDRYAAAGFMLATLSLSLMTLPMLFIRNAFTAAGDTRATAINSILQAISLVLLLIGGFFVFGPMGAVAAVAVSRLVPAGAIFCLARRRGWTSALAELRVVPLFVLGLLLGKSVLTIGGLMGVLAITPPG